jgi:hypothetical protein
LYLKIILISRLCRRRGEQGLTCMDLSKPISLVVLSAWELDLDSEERRRIRNILVENFRVDAVDTAAGAAEDWAILGPSQDERAVKAARGAQSGGHGDGK